MKLKHFAAAVALIILPGLALAQTGSTPRVDKRQDRQQQRIDKGVQSGALNEKEAARLQKGQQRVQKMEDKAMADGKMTKKERARIEHAQDRQNKKIARQKHDKQRVK
ncbi:MAG TPA: hypothetical protein VED01_01810 [Burkholderiales bacterium]|nr:hypothetical protein [Burkholderiales bacterium]